MDTENRMSEARASLHESLSAAVDGEAEELELRRVLNAARSSSELQARWECMHLVGEALRGTAALTVHHRQTASWRAHAGNAEFDAEDLEPPATRRRLSARRWFGPLAGSGVAATVALAVVLYFGAEETTPPSPANAVAAAGTPASLAQLPSEQDLRRANAYLLQHTSMTARPAATPFGEALAGPDGIARPALPANNRLREASSR